MRPPPNVTISLYGEGKTDIGKAGALAAPPTKGVLPVLVHTLCGNPPNMLVRRHPIPLLQGKGLRDKIRFAKLESAKTSAGIVFVMDTEGDREKRIRELVEGRDSALPAFPMAIGAPHPCIEVWLLAAPGAIMKGMGLGQPPAIPPNLETLPASMAKTALAQCGGKTRGELSTAEKDRIALQIVDLGQLRTRCPTSFAPFADEIEQRIRPLFVPQEPVSPS